MDDQLAVADLIAQRRPAAHPDALLAGGRDLVADALADQLPLELGKGDEDVQGHAAHGVLGVEGLGDRNEGDAVAFEQLDQIQEIEHRAGKPVDLVDDNDVDLAGLHIARSRFRAGRSIVPPEKPPSS